MEKMEFSGKQKAEAMQYQWTKRADVWKTEALVLILLTAFAFVINRHMEIKGLYMDDLYQWFCFNDNPFIAAVFTSGGTRFRALYNLVAWTEMKLFGTHVNWYVPFNIVLNSCLAYNLYRMAKRFSHSAYVGILCAVMFLMSRMSYYQIGQALGLMETMAMWMALGILYFLLEYLGDEDETSANRRLYLAAVLYFCVCLVHERYMVLLPLFYFSLLFKLSKNWKLWAAPTVGFALIQLLRFIFIGTISPPGTGGTDVVDTMSVSSVLHFVLSQIAYIFGINAGPEHLNGQNFREAPLGVTILIALADLMIAVLVLAFVIRVLHKGKKMVPYLQKTFLFVAFIGACIVCSSVTIRVEMRWVYVSLAAALLFLSWMYGSLTEQMAKRGRWVQALPYLSLFTLYVLFMLPVEHYYRGLFPNLYYWADQEHYNALAEETYGQYGVGIFGKTIYIVGDKFEMDDFTQAEFFRVFDRLNREDCVKVVHIRDLRDIGLITDDMLVIQEDPENNRFQDITHAASLFKCRPICGFYDDGWLDERASVQVMAGSTGEIHLSFNYPRDLTDDQWLTVYVDGEPTEYINFTEQNAECAIQVDPYQPVTLRFESNFYVPNALEKRGVTRLAVLLKMTAD